MFSPFCVTTDRTPGTGTISACRTMVTMRIRLITVLTGAVAVALVAGGTLAAPPAGADSPGVDALLQQRLLNPRIGDDVGMIVIEAASGALVSAHDPDALLLPASTMKIITAVTALSTLGADGRFTTRVRAGSLPNEVILQGGGDPLLTSADLQDLADDAAPRLPADIRIVVRVDDDLFPATGRAPGWTTEYLPYAAAPVEALARLGDYSADPSTNAAMVFVKRLRSLGIKAKLGDPADADEGAAVLADSQSSVDDAVRRMLSVSENNVAEVLFRQVAVASGLEATWAGAREAAERVLEGLGIDPEGMRLLDGSGLSRRDRLSPRFLANVLRVARVTKPAPFAVMFEPDALPVAGETGTLATAYGRYVTKQARCARGDVQAKTGSLYDTIALSGVAETTEGGERLFAILVNDRPQSYSALSTRQALDGLTATITGCWD